MNMLKGGYFYGIIVTTHVSKVTKVAESRNGLLTYLMVLLKLMSMKF